jgi:electron transfer flavoprotein alpha subunit
VALSAWAPLNRLVGVSGAITKPEVCIAAAVSGAPAFYAGITHSKKIIALNSDDQAPITKAADVVIVDDYKTIIDALVKVILEAKGDEKT